MAAERTVATPELWVERFARTAPPVERAAPADGVQMTVRGVPVRFPHRPYRAQIRIINGVIEAATSGTNALIESPTGTGKTKALLCSALAWQASASSANELLAVGAPGAKRSAASTVRRPRVYYCTRTHSQIAQVVRELGDTSYSPTMAILASREHTCIHPKVSMAPNKNEACMRLLDARKCGQYHGAKALARSSRFRPSAAHPTWDIEDLVGAGQLKSACPYFAARELAQHADIVFCPYNYVLSPSIRTALGIELDGALVIFDEAHNVEDVAREVGSTVVAADALRSILRDFDATLEQLDPDGAFGQRCTRLVALVRRIHGWVEGMADVEFKRAHDDAVGYYVFDADGLLAALDAWGATEAAIDGALADARALRHSVEAEDKAEGAAEGAASNASDDEGLNFVTRETVQQLCELLVGISYLVEGGGRFVDDFRLAVSQTRANKHVRGGGRARTIGRAQLGLELWCLNPAVVFGRLTSDAHSVILTSGTLAPLATFSAELGVPFGVQIECDHVIGADQFVAAALTHAVGGGELVATYRNTQTPAFIDALGRTIVALCAAIPAGVLIFMPSYALLRSATERWRANGILAELERIKECFVESANKQDGSFADMLAAYYAAAPRGAALFAVYRGKAAEGINFADDNARGVLCVGVPYPSLTDLKVKAKYDYNRVRALADAHRLGADAWYDTQAVRAVCQAMGRCLRHVNDRGAIILLDARYARDKHRSLLSKWVRSALGVYASPTALADRLREFAAPPAPPAPPAP